MVKNKLESTQRMFHERRPKTCLDAKASCQATLACASLPSTVAGRCELRAFAAGAGLCGCDAAALPLCCSHCRNPGSSTRSRARSCPAAVKRPYRFSNATLELGSKNESFKRFTSQNKHCRGPWGRARAPLAPKMHEAPSRPWQNLCPPWLPCLTCQKRGRRVQAGKKRASMTGLLLLRSGLLPRQANENGVSLASPAVPPGLCLYKFVRHLNCGWNLHLDGESAH